MESKEKELTHEEMLEIAEQREKENALVVKVSNEDYQKVLNAMKEQEENDE